MASSYIDLVDEQLRNSKTIAVVGLSNNPERDSHRVASYLQSQGYRIIPVNPVIEEALGEKSYPDLKSVPEPIDMVDVFRRSDQVPPVVDEAIALESKVTELIGMVGSLQAAMQQDMNTLSGKIESVHVDVNVPIVKRLF